MEISMSEWTEKDFEIYDAIDWKLFKEIKALTDENLNNLAVLRRAYQLSLIALDLSIRHSDDNGADALVMDLHEYVGERLFIAEGKNDNDSWAKEFAKPIDQFIAYGEKKFAK